MIERGKFRSLTLINWNGFFAFAKGRLFLQVGTVSGTISTVSYTHLYATHVGKP